MAYTLETIEEAYDELELEDSFLLEEDDDHQIWLDGPFIRIEALQVDIYPGQYLVFDEEEGEYMPDFSIYVFMKIGTKQVVYDEGYTSFGAAVHNFIRRNSDYQRLDITKLQYELHVES